MATKMTTLACPEYKRTARPMAIAFDDEGEWGPIAAFDLNVYEALHVTLKEGCTPLHLGVGLTTPDQSCWIPNVIPAETRLEQYLDWLSETYRDEYDELEPWPRFVAYERTHLFDLYGDTDTSSRAPFLVRVDEAQQVADKFHYDPVWLERLQPVERVVRPLKSPRSN